MDIHSRGVLIYRWVTFLLAAGYVLYQVATSDYSSAGGPFRYLTIWALMMSFYSASRMLALSERRITRSHHITATVAAVINTMVVYLYWTLFFDNPKNVGDGNGVVWHQEYYLHLLGPLLQVIDSLFVARVYRRAWRAVPALLGVVAAYVLWAEFFVRRFNDNPLGSVTSGLPYPFLNNLELADRAVFYGVNFVFALVVLLVFAVLGWMISRFLPQKAL